VNVQLAAWFVHPVTLLLGLAAAGMALVILEALATALGDMGNVRFQGLLEDHPSLLPTGATEPPVHLSQVLDALRWLELACAGAVWLLIPRLVGGGAPRRIALAAGIPILAVVVARLLARSLTEEHLAALLRVVRPALRGLLRTVARRPGPEGGPVEDEEEEVSEREIQAFLDVGEAAGIFEEEEGELLGSLVEFFDTTVREVMTPRTDMVAVPRTTSFDELLAIFAETHRSRIPVYEGTVDHIQGVVHVKSVVEHLKNGDRPAAGELARECLVVPEAKKLGDLLRDFQQQHQQMAIVVDEYGGTAGLVTLEDVLEEIVGEIRDEHEAGEPPEWQQVREGVFRLQGRAPLEVLEELFGVEVDEEEVDTVGGLVFARYGTVPETGAEVVDEGLGLRFVVEQVDERRVAAVLVERLAGQGETGE